MGKLYSIGTVASKYRLVWRGMMAVLACSYKTTIKSSPQDSRGGERREARGLFYFSDYDTIIRHLSAQKHSSAACCVSSIVFLPKVYLLLYR
jgi:hypothetical protein